MKLEDAFLYVVFDNGLAGDQLVEACGQAVAGGGDVIQIAAGGDIPVDIDTVRRVVELCGDGEALMMLRDDAELSRALGASGVHLESAGAEMGIVRAMLGDDRIVGVTSDSLDDARLSLEIGADYLLHRAGRNCPAEFMALRDEARVPLFAGGLEGVEDAESLVANGVFRISIETSRLEKGSLAESVARYARLLGRCL